jgi:hypothetical protein
LVDLALCIIAAKLLLQGTFTLKKEIKMTRSILLAALLALTLGACSKEEAAAPAPDIATPAAEAAPADAAPAEAVPAEAAK